MKNTQNEKNRAPGPIKPCGSSPNCVSSCDQRDSHSVQPFPWPHADRDSVSQDSVSQDPVGQDPIALIVSMLDLDPHAQLITRETLYLHYVFKTSLLGFKDDVEFYANPGTQQVDVRSASRVGYWDLGTNRRRVEALRQRYLQICSGG